MSKGLDYLINLKEGSMVGSTKAKSELNGLDNAVERSGKNISGMGSIARNVGGILAGAFAISTILDFGSAAEQAYKGMKAADAQTTAAIKSTGAIAGQSLDDLKASADALQATTLFDADDTSGAQSLLLTFTNIRGAIFDKAIPAIQDMAQRMGGDGPADLKGASIQVGKALNDPIRGISALSKVGVTFTETQKKTIESMVLHNNTAGAQALILKELNTEFGGSAIAAREAAGGAADLHFATEDLKEGFGELISSGTEPFYSSMTNIVTGLTAGVDWIKQNSDMLKTLGIELAIAGAAYVTGSAALGIYNAYQAATATGTTLWTIAQQGLNAAFYANPIGIVIGGIALLVAGFTVAYKKSETFRAGIDGLIEVGKLLGSVFMGVGKTIIGALTFDKSMFMEGLIETGKVTEKILGGGIQKAFKKGFEDSSANFKAEELASKKGKTGIDAIIGKTPKTAGIKPGVNAAESGGTSLSSTKQSRNVSVTIGKLVESLTVSTTNLQGSGSADIKRMITEILTGAVHDSELALSSD